MDWKAIPDPVPMQKVYNINYIRSSLIRVVDPTLFAGLGGGSDLDNNDNTQTITNETDSELSSLSHVDAPNDIIYTICGVLIAMLLVGVIIILVAVTINKLRKREDSSTTVSPTALEAQQSSFGLQNRSNSANVHANANLNSSSNNNTGGTYNQQHQDHQQVFITNSSPTEFDNAATVVSNDFDVNNIAGCDSTDSNQVVTFTRSSGVATDNSWVFPPKAPTPNMYNCMNNNTLLATNEKHSFKGQGFRKQFSGRFKRLVTKKPDSVQPIPPELKPQLKTIYVY